jgi:shikimate dehydrogenase
MSYLVGLVGAGIAGSLSPALHEREAELAGLRYVYRIIDLDGPAAEVELSRLVSYVRRVGFDGLNVTHPYKQTVIPHLDELSPEAAVLGAVNTVVFQDGRAIGHNTDGYGFTCGFARQLADVPIRHVVQLGAGGAGAAIAHAMLRFGVERLTVVDSAPERARELVSSLRARFGGDRADAADADRLADPLVRADGLINTTPIGMTAHPGMPVPADLLRPGMWVCDIIYRPLETQLLLRSRELGCATLGGGPMLVFQAAEAMRLFAGITPDTERMLAHFAELVGGETHPESAETALLGDR